MNHFLIGLWILYPMKTLSSVIGPEESPKQFPKPTLHQKKGHGHCSVICCPSDSLQLSPSQQKIISEKFIQQIDEMH